MLFADEDLASGEYGWTRPYCIWSRIASLMVWSTSQVIVAFGRPITGDPRPKPPWAPFLCIHRSRDTGPTNAFLLIHEAQQGCRDATYEPSRFPVAVPYPSPHRATPAYVVVTSSDLDTSRNKASVSGLSWISRNAFHADGVGDSRQHPTVNLASCVDGVNQAIKFMRESGQSQPGAPLVLQNIPASSTLGSRHSRIHRS